MKNLSKRWTQSGPFFQNQSTFFNFLKRTGFLTEFSYTLFTKMLFCISLLKRFIYRRVDTSQILLGATTPVTLKKNQIKTISIHFIRKKCPSSKVIYCLLTRKIQPREKSCSPDRFRIFHMFVEETLSPIAYITEWTFIGIYSNYNDFFLLTIFQTINDYFQMMHTVLGRFSKFKMLSIPIPSSC